MVAQTLCQTRRKCAISSPGLMQARVTAPTLCMVTSTPSCRAPAERGCRQPGAVWRLLLAALVHVKVPLGRSATISRAASRTSTANLVPGRTAACLPCRRSNCADQELLGPGVQMFSVAVNFKRNREQWVEINIQFRPSTRERHVSEHNLSYWCSTKGAFPTNLRLLRCARMLLAAHSVLANSDDEESLGLNSFTDPCPELTKMKETAASNLGKEAPSNPKGSGPREVLVIHIRFVPCAR